MSIKFGVVLSIKRLLTLDFFSYKIAIFVVFSNYKCLFVVCNMGSFVFKY